jgi:hypothetical protein
MNQRRRSNVATMPAFGLSVLITLGLTALGCLGGEDATETKIGALVPGPGINASPQGLTCGMAYYSGSTPIVDNTCVGRLTKEQAPAVGFALVNDGDRGASSGSGFYHQGWTTSDPAIVTSGPNENTDQLELPPGTACGFKELCNDAGQTCMGYDPAQNHCPPGWAARVSSDLGAPGGCNFVWCEYLDPNHTCPLGSSCAATSGFARGTACGINDNDRNTGSCFGVVTTQTSTCPSGYTKFGFYDAGRRAGHGIGWCALQP